MSAGHRHGDEKAASAVADKYYDSAAKLVAACTVVDTFDIPWLANRSMDGKTVYRDKRVPKVLKCGIDTSLSLPWHELPEWEAMNDGMLYDTGDPSAHVDVATPLERREVERQKPDDPDIWSKYSDEMDGLIREVDDETIKRVPLDIDLRPFKDDDRKLLEEIIAAQAAEESFTGTLFHGTDEEFEGDPVGPNGWTWWTPDRDWSQKYGARVIERDLGELRLFKLPSEPSDAVDALNKAGVDTTGHDWDVQESYRALSDPTFGPVMEGRVSAAGYDGFSHIDNRYAEGKGRALALTNTAIKKRAASSATQNAQKPSSRRTARLESSPMPQILKPLDVAKRLKAGEKREDIFLDANGAVKAKLIGPRATVRAVGDDTSRSIDFVISTESIDRYDSTLSLGGWKLANYRRNPVVLWGHDDCTPAIGRGFNIRSEGGLCSSVEFAPREIYPLADTIYQLLKAKFLNAASVGFIPLAYQWSNDESRPYGIDFEEQELLEWSVVNIPANPDCLVQARSAGIDCGPIVKWAERALDQGGMAVISRAELEQLRKSAGAPVLVGPRGGKIDWDKITLLPDMVDELARSLRAAGGGKRAGKVLSAENEKKLQTAHDHVKAANDHCTAAMEHVKSVIEQNKKDPDADDDATGGSADGTNDDPEQAAAAAAATAAAELEQRTRRLRLLKLKSPAAAA